MPTFASEVNRLRDEMTALTERNEGFQRWRALMKAKGADVDEDGWREAKECGCGGCEVCRPDLAAVAEILDVPLLNVLMLCKQAEAEVIDRAMQLVKPGPSRSQRRVSDRAKQKRSKKDKLAELKRRAEDPGYNPKNADARAIETQLAKAVAAPSSLAVLDPDLRLDEVE